MKKNLSSYRLEKGQVLPLVVLMMFVIIGMVALLLDGGAIMSNRRTAQAAADAGALAGAQQICEGATGPEAIAVAKNFAQGKNDATFAEATILASGLEIKVATEVERTSFFAKIFGEDNLMASAEATAGCFYPSNAIRVLPLAFYYGGAPLGADATDCTEDNSCNLVNRDFEELMEELTDTEMVENGIVNYPLDDIYIISDSIKVCEKDAGVFYCSDMQVNAGGGARTFIDLTKIKDPPANLSNIIQDGVDEPLRTPSWVNVQGAVNADVYNDTNYENFDPIPDYETLEARLFYVPVFDQFCEEDPENTCSTDTRDIFDYLVNENQASYRLIGFAPFVVTGVTKNNTCTFGDSIPVGTWKLGGVDITIKNNAEPCPGYAALKIDLEADGETISKDSIEGYFVSDLLTDQYLWGTEGVDTGIYLISLSK